MSGKVRCFMDAMLAGRWGAVCDVRQKNPEGPAKHWGGQAARVVRVKSADLKIDEAQANLDRLKQFLRTLAIRKQSWMSGREPDEYEVHESW